MKTNHNGCKNVWNNSGTRLRRARWASRARAQAPAGVMEEQVLEAGFRDVHVGEFDASACRSIDDGGDQRPSTIGIDVSTRLSRCAHFGDARQRCQPLKQRGGRLRSQSVSASSMLWVVSRIAALLDSWMISQSSNLV